LRGDGHYGRPEIMAWCEASKVDYVFGLPGNRALHAHSVIVAAADAVCVARATRRLPVLRRYAETRYTAKSWAAQSWAAQSWGDTGRRVVARIEASTLGLDIRIAFASACPDAALFRHVAISLRAASP
jgi:hypothetical protein